MVEAQSDAPCTFASSVSYTAFDTLDVYFDDVAESCLPLRNNFTLHTQSLQRNLDLCTNVILCNHHLS